MSAATPLVLLPGTLCTDAVFAAQAAAFRAAGHEVHVTPLGPERHVDAHADAVLAHAPERFALAGFSQGAITALAILRRAPERVTRAALLALNPGAATDAQRETWAGWRRDAHDRDARRAIAERLRRNVAPARQDDRDLAAAILTMAVDTPGTSFEGQLEALASRPDAWATLADVRLPLALAVGRDDPVTPLDLHERVRDRLPEGTPLTVIEGAGHYAPLERPDAVTDWLREALVAPPDPERGIG